MSSYAAIDLGATSGRVLRGTLDGGRVELEEVHRFDNRPVRLPDGLRWNLLHLFTECVAGLRRTGWGVVREVSGVLRLVDCGVVRTVSAGKEFSTRLARIYHELAKVLGRCKPDEAAIEQFECPATRKKTESLAEVR